MDGEKSSDRTMTGGCLCRRIRYEARVASDEASLCHCTYCRRATGGVSATFVNLPVADVRWTAEAPDRYRSSPIAERPFCARCGTPLGFHYLDSDRMDLTVGSFDEPGYFRPTSKFSVETKLDAWEDTGELPGERLDDKAEIVERWTKATGGMPA